MTLKETITRWQPGPLQVIILLALLQLLVTLLTNGFVLSFDEAMWHYIGRNWFRHGLVPYSGGIDNKSPLIFAIFGLSDTLFGVNYWFPRIIGTVCQSIGIYYVYKIAKHLAGKQAGILAISFYGLSLLWHATGGEYVSFTETYEVMFVIVAFYWGITAQNTKDFFIGGFLGGIGLCFRLTAFFCIIALLIAFLNKNRTKTFTFLAGALSGILLLIVIGTFAGINPHDLFTYMFADNFGAGSATDHTLAWRLENLSEKFLYSPIILFYPLVVAYLFIKRKLDLFVLWLIFAFIGINVIGIYDRVHIKEVLPALSLISAFSVNHLINIYKLPVKLIMLVLWVVFFPNLLQPLDNLKKVFWAVPDKQIIYCKAPYRKPDEGVSKKLGWWIKSNTAVQEKVLVAGFGAQVQVYSERISPTVYFNVTQTKIAKERFFQDMKLNKPGMILVPLFSEYKQYVALDMRVFVDSLIKEDYYLDRCIYSYNIYKIKR
jgi:4-amino-4-deoxy-L-arabinose transferase-like glycosyltransferase